MTIQGNSALVGLYRNNGTRPVAVLALGPELAASLANRHGLSRSAPDILADLAAGLVVRGRRGFCQLMGAGDHASA